MSKIRCPEESCQKEFETPIVVNNFTCRPIKETYYACPFCLAKIEFVHDTNLNQESVVEETNTITTQQKDEQVQQSISVEKVLKETKTRLSSAEEIENLEKEKKDLMLELELLRTNAIKKVNDLQEEVAKLKEESEKLKEIIDEQD